MFRLRFVSIALCLLSTLLAISAVTGCDPAATDLTVTEGPPTGDEDLVEPAPLDPSPGVIIRTPGNDEEQLPPGVETRLWATSRCHKGLTTLTVGYHVGTPEVAAVLPVVDSAVVTLSRGDKRQSFELRAAPSDLAAIDHTLTFTRTLKPGESLLTDCDALADATLHADVVMKDGETVCRIDGPALQPRHVECSK